MSGWSKCGRRCTYTPQAPEEAHGILPEELSSDWPESTAVMDTGFAGVTCFHLSACEARRVLVHTDGTGVRAEWTSLGGLAAQPASVLGRRGVGAAKCMCCVSPAPAVNRLSLLVAVVTESENLQGCEVFPGHFPFR